MPAAHYLRSVPQPSRRRLSHTSVPSPSRHRAREAPVLARVGIVIITLLVSASLANAEYREYDEEGKTCEGAEDGAGNGAR